MKISLVKIGPVSILEVGEFQSLPDRFVLLLLEGVEVDPEGAGEEDGVLGNDGELLPQMVQTYSYLKGFENERIIIHIHVIKVKS